MEVEKRPYRFPAIYFEATRLCNLQCSVCMAGSNDAERVRASCKQELSSEEIRDLVLIPAQRLGVLAIGWSGGEETGRVVGHVIAGSGPETVEQQAIPGL